MASAYGLAFLKSEFYAAGGRPAIYGLASTGFSYRIKEEFCRILPSEILPEAEQYRLVSYNPIGNTPIDWTHEREWRWKADKANDCHSIYALDWRRCQDELPGLPLFRGTGSGGYFTQLCLLVWSADEAEDIQEALTGFAQAGHNDYDTPFCRQVIEASRIIILEEVVAAVEDGREFDSSTIEGVAKACLMKPTVIHESDKNDKAVDDRILGVLNEATRVGEERAEEYQKRYPDDPGPCGFAYAATTDVRSPIVQHLLRTGAASGPFDGKVLLSLSGSWRLSQSLNFKIAVYDAICEVLREALDVSFHPFSRLD